MTTDTTVTTATTDTPVDTHKAKAIGYVNTHSMADIIDALAESDRALDRNREAHRGTSARLQQLVDTVTEFIKDNLDTGASKSDLRELAAELDIELTKSMTITFTVEYQADIVVPIDFDEDSISESDFDVEISYNDHSSDVEFENDAFGISDFSVEEN